MSKNKAVYAIFKTREQVERAVDQLRMGGFDSNQISALFPNPQGTKEFAHEKETKAPEGAATGATSGALLGGTLGWLAGIGTLAIPGLGPFIAAGPIMATLAGAGIGGTAGGITGALIGAGIPEYEAKRYEGHVKNGGILLSVDCSTGDQVDRAKHLLKAAGGEDVASASEGSADAERKAFAEGQGRDRGPVLDRDRDIGQQSTFEPPTGRTVVTPDRSGDQTRI